GRLEVDDDVRRRFDEQLGSSGRGERDRVAAPAQSRVRLDDLGEQGARECDRRGSEREEPSRGLVRDDRSTPLLDQLHEAVGGVEAQLHGRDARRTYVRSQQLRTWNDVLYSRVPAGIGKGAGVNQKVKLPALLAALALTLVVVSSSSAAHRGATAAGTMVYAGA